MEKRVPELELNGVKLGCNGCKYITSLSKDGVIRCTKPFQDCRGVIFIDEDTNDEKSSN